jgi:PAS domain S-box-containing protein
MSRTMTNGLVEEASDRAPARERAGEPLGPRHATVAPGGGASTALAELRALVDGADDAMNVVDVDGTVRSWNRAAERLFGYRASEIVGAPIARLVPDDRAGEAAEMLARVVAGERIESVETVRVTRDGRRVDVALTLVPNRDAAGRVVSMSSIARDLRERREARAEVDAHASRVRLCMEHAPVAIAMFDRDLRYLEHSRRWPTVLGIAETDLVGRSLYEASPPMTPTWRAILELALGGEEVSGDAARYRLADGAVRWLAWEVGPWRDPSGEIGGLVIVVKDRTALESAREELARQQQLLTLALDAARAGTWTWDVSSGRWAWSTLAARLHGLDPDAPASFDALLRAVHPEDRARVAATRAAAAAMGMRVRLEYRAVLPTGDVRWMLSRGQPEVDERGAPVSYRGLVFDVTEYKLQEATLRETDQRKDAFLATLSHELRNPLTPIRTSLAVLDRVAADDARGARARAVIGRQTAHLGHLVDELLDVTRLVNDKVRLDREVIDLGAVVRRVVEDHGAAFAARGVTLAFTAPAETVWVDCDPTRVRQIVSNLLQNAAKFTSAAGSVRVEVASGSGFATIDVRDDGIGLEAAMLEKIFEPFAQAEAGRAQSSTGLGLGLALVKGLSELHGGSAEAESAGPGMGARFRVTLPLAHEVPRVRTPVPTEPPDAGRRVLVVDDSVDVAASLRDLLECARHEVEIAHDGHAAVALARAFRPDVVICDLTLPGKDGFDVARELRADPGTRDATLFALSGRTSAEDVRRAKEAGFDAHFAKPADPTRLERSVAAARRRP